MKKLVILLFFSFIPLLSLLSQEEVKFFAQGLFQIDNVDEIKAIENTIRENSHVQIARLDIPTNRFFIISKDDPITDSMLTNWFGEDAASLKCIQFGQYGVDTLKSYPFIDCNE